MKLFDFKSIKNITSDCVPCDKSKDFSINKETGAIEAKLNDEWYSEIEQIYKNYNIYKQASGEEQPVFSGTSGIGSARSEKIIDNLIKENLCPNNGVAMDIGCGNGGFLKAFSQRFENWKLYGTEYNEKYKQTVESIPNVIEMLSVDIDDIENDFDLISLIHVLEHIPHPINFLKNVHKRLKTNGHLLIQLPYYIDNPFELSIFDHASHFSKASIQRTLELAGFKISNITNNWVTKELSIVASPSTVVDINLNDDDITDEISKLEKQINWLHRIIDQINHLPNQENIAIFGSSIAATWLNYELNKNCAFFVDEDTNRRNQKHLGINIISPAEIPNNAVVYIAQSPEIASSIATRLSESCNPSIQFITPPMF